MQDLGDLAEGAGDDLLRSARASGARRRYPCSHLQRWSSFRSASAAPTIIPNGRLCAILRSRW